MADRKPLAQVAADWAGDDSTRRAVADTVSRLADTAASIAAEIAAGPLAGDLAAVVGDNADGDAQKALDVRANDMIIAALQESPVAVLGSEECAEPIVLNGEGCLALVMDPLDGSSNIETNVSVGTIFSLYPISATGNGTPHAAILHKGRNQLAAGFFIYGPQTALVISFGDGCDIFTLDPKTGAFVRTRRQVSIPEGKREFAINASNYRHWDAPVRTYIEDCIAGETGPLGENYNMRWVASLVAEAYRILTRGGVFLYPGDDREGYRDGRLRLVYEANAIAFLIEQAGGAATNGTEAILDIEPGELHQRTALVFGSTDHVERVARYLTQVDADAGDHPLFGERSLFRA